MASNLLTCKLAADGSADFEIGVLVGAIENLVTAYGNQLPAWFAVHPYYPDDADCASIEDQSILASLMVIDNVLTGKGLSQPLVIQETYHDDAKVAAGVAKFMASSPRPIDELMEWPVTSDANGVTVEPPYTLKNYLPLQKMPK
jgi:hypothetical protein